MISKTPDLSVQSLKRRRNGFFGIAAHRGFSEGYRDNSRDSYNAAILAGADLIEMDVRQSCDGVLVCQHDPYIGRRLVRNMTGTELAQRGVMTLAQALETVAGRGRVLFDIKNKEAEFPLRILDHVLASGIEDCVVFGVRTTDQISPLLKESPNAVIWGFVPPKCLPEFYDMGGSIGRIWEQSLTQRRLDLAGAGRHPVWVMADDSPLNSGIRPGNITEERLTRLLDYGVDGVVVNNPARAIAFRTHYFQCREISKPGTALTQPVLEPGI